MTDTHPPHHQRRYISFLIFNADFLKKYNRLYEDIENRNSNQVLIEIEKVRSSLNAVLDSLERDSIGFYTQYNTFYFSDIHNKCLEIERFLLSYQSKVKNFSNSRREDILFLNFYIYSQGNKSKELWVYEPRYIISDSLSDFLQKQEILRYIVHDAEVRHPYFTYPDSTHGYFTLDMFSARTIINHLTKIKDLPENAVVIDEFHFFKSLISQHVQKKYFLLGFSSIKEVNAENTTLPSDLIRDLNKYDEMNKEE